MTGITAVLLIELIVLIFIGDPDLTTYEYDYNTYHFKIHQQQKQYRHAQDKKENTDCKS